MKRSAALFMFLCTILLMAQNSSPTATDIRDRGARCDGSDAGPAIRRALAGAANVVISPCLGSEANAYYTVSSFGGTYSNNSWAFILTSANNYQRVTGSGTIRMGNGLVNSGGQMFGGGGFLLNGVTGLRISDITIDMNGANNLVVNGTTRNAIAFKSVGASLVYLDGVTVLNPSGQNAMVFDSASSYVGVHDSHIVGSGQCLSSNPYQVDWTAIYDDAPHADFSHNTIENCPSTGGYLSYPQGPAAGIECHNGPCTLVGNDIDYVYPGIYVSANAVSTTADGSVVAGNHIRHAYIGIIINQLTLNRLAITGNDIALIASTWPASVLSSGVPSTGIWEIPWSSPESNFTILNDCAITGNPITGTEPTPPATALTSGMILSAMNGCQISGNPIDGVSSNAIIVFGTGYGLTRTGITNNQISNWGQNLSASGHEAIVLSLTGVNKNLISTTTATAGSGASTLTVASSTGIAVGQIVAGTNLATNTLVGGAYVAGSTTVPITINTTGVLSATAVTFSNSCLEPCSQYQNLTSVTIADNRLKMDASGVQAATSGISLNWDNTNSVITDLDIHGNTLQNVPVLYDGASAGQYGPANSGYNQLQTDQYNTLYRSVADQAGLSGFSTGLGNMLSQSDAFNLVPWGSGNLTFTASAAVSPDGTMDAYRIQSAVANIHSLGQPAAGGITVLPNTTYTQSIFVEQNGGGTNPLHWAAVDITHSSAFIFIGPYSHAPVASWAGSPQPTGSRLTGTFVTPPGCVSIAVYPIYNGDANATLDLHAWGAQLVQGASPGPLIHTTSSPVTFGSGGTAFSFVIPPGGTLSVDPTATTSEATKGSNTASKVTGITVATTCTSSSMTFPVTIVCTSTPTDPGHFHVQQ